MRGRICAALREAPPMGPAGARACASLSSPSTSPQAVRPSQQWEWPQPPHSMQGCERPATRIIPVPLQKGQIMGGSRLSFLEAL